ncbi:MAG: efflux RND transporter permease subunit [Planctomycetia bacterium]|nr:MAG: efflux RND transporter permease subunit [Planctomycetia bacterium]
MTGNLIQLCLRRPVGVSVGVLLTVLFGLLAVFMIPVQLTPNVDTPIITVTTAWPGANPQEVEQEIVERQEEFLQSVKGLKKLTSESLEGQAKVTLEFYTGADRAEALRETTDRLRQVSGYPLEVKEPTVVAADASIDNPIAWIILYDRNGDGEATPALRDFAEDFIKPYLDRVEGVASVDVYGGWEREVQIVVDAGLLAARGLSHRQVADALRRQNANVSAGARTQGKRDFAVRTVGQFQSLDEMRNTVIAFTPGGPVYIRDVAEVREGFKRATSLVRSKGQTVLAFPVRRETGRNVIQVMNGVKAAVENVNRDVLEARNMRLELTQVYDETIYITQAISMVRGNAVFGGFLTIGVLLMFLRSWRAASAVALSIPISVVGTFVVIVAMGRTLNVISLAGIAFAIGMVVDNSIVVLENIYRHRQMGKPLMQACLDGAGEVWGAVLAGTLTTLAVFIPVIFIQEEAGQLFRDISIATAAAVSLSLIVSMTVLPPLARKVLSLGRRSTENAPLSSTDAARAAIDAGDAPTAVGRWFAQLHALLSANVGLRLGVILLMVVVSLGGMRLLIPPATYLPSGNRNLVFGFLITPPGYSMEEYKRMAQVIEAYVGPYWRVEAGSDEHRRLNEDWVRRIEPRIAGRAIPEIANAAGPLQRARAQREWLTPPPLIDNFFFVSFDGGCFMGCSSRDAARVRPLVRLLTEAGQQIPGTFPVFFQTELFSFGGGNNAEIQIRGDNLEEVNAAALAIQMAVMQKIGFPQSSPTNFALGRPEARIVPDRERCADLGLTAEDVGFIVETCVDGSYVGDYRKGGGDTIDISIYTGDQRNRPTGQIAQVPIFAPSGEIAPLGAAVRIVDTTSPEKINHIERQRAVTLTVRPSEAQALESVIEQVKNEIIAPLRNSGVIAPGVLVSMAGNADKLTEARNAMLGEWKGYSIESVVNLAGGRFLLSILIVYLLMVALYESWVYPFVIMFSVPLALFGGFAGLYVCHVGTMLTRDQPVQQLDVLTFLGFVILVGTVVNNAILLVDQSLQNRRDRELSIADSVRLAVATRARPVLMTSMTTIFGQLPLALMPGAGSELYRGLAAVMIGGMLISAIGTLILVPLVMRVVMELREGASETPAGSPIAMPVPVPAVQSSSSSRAASTSAVGISSTSASEMVRQSSSNASP